MDISGLKEEKLFYILLLFVYCQIYLSMISCAADFVFHCLQV